MTDLERNNRGGSRRLERDVGINIEDLTIGQVREIAGMVGSGCAQDTTPHHRVGEHCIIRSYGAGVFAGTVEAVMHHAGGTEVRLSKARRIWKWSGGLSLSEVAQIGPDPDGSRVAVEVPDHTIDGVIEIIPTTDAARKRIEACHE